MAIRRNGFLSATAVAALLALSPLSVTTDGVSLQTAWADNGDKGTGRDSGGNSGPSGDSADAGKAGGGGNSAAGSNPSGTEGNQGNSGAMGNAGGSVAGGKGDTTKDDDHDDDDVQVGDKPKDVDDDRDDETQVGEKPKDVSPPMGNAFGQRDRRDGSPPFGNAFGHRDRQDATRDDAHTRAASVLGNLNAAHASPQARANAAPNSMVGQIAAYEAAMQQALALNDAARRDAAIIAAREQLARAANKPLTADVIAQVDHMLGIQNASPQLGALR